MTAPLTISEKRAWAGAQAKVRSAVHTGDRAELTSAQAELEQIRQYLYEGDPDE